MRKAVKMAEEEEGVGDSSSRRLHGVREAVRELMREALHSEENSALLAELTESGPSDLATLIEEKQRLLQEKTSCEFELELRKRLCEEPVADTTVDLEHLEERVAELEGEVSAVKCRLSQDQQLIQRLQSSEVLTEHLFQRPDPTTEDKALREVVVRQCAVSVKVGRVAGEAGEREREVMRMKKERGECLKHCRELIAQIERLRREFDEEGERGGADDVGRLRVVYEAKQAEYRLLRGCLQGLIVGSGVDWCEEEQLRDLTVSLGQPLSWEPTH